MNPSHRLTRYAIRLEGHIDRRWLNAYEDLTLTLEPGGDTLINGKFDQAALFGVLNLVRDLGLVLISVEPVPTQDNVDTNGETLA